MTNWYGDQKIIICSCGAEYLADQPFCPVCGVVHLELRKPLPDGLISRPKHTKKSELESMLLGYLELLAPELPSPEFQYYPRKDKDWRIDFVYEDKKIAIEVDGGERMLIGGHTWGEGFVRDRIQQNWLVLRGWRVLRFAGSQIKDNPQYCIDTIREAYHVNI